jgi:hypothetical protein
LDRRLGRVTFAFEEIGEKLESVKSLKVVLEERNKLRSKEVLTSVQDRDLPEALLGNDALQKRMPLCNEKDMLIACGTTKNTDYIVGPNKSAVG